MPVTAEQNNNTITTKARYWVGVGYPENMRPDWKDVIGEVTQLPYAYCVHDKDVDGAEDDRKEHVHILLAFPNTTTYKSALSILQELSAPGKKAFNTVQKVNNVRFMYNYLIHDSRKKHKHQYDPKERITGNNFDIGSYEQISVADRQRIRREIGMMIFEHPEIVDYSDLYAFIISNCDPEYEDVLCANSGHFWRLCGGRFRHREE